MDRNFIYRDNANLLVSAKEVAAEREGGDVRTRVRIHFRNLLELARRGRPTEKAVAVGSIPPELRQAWNRLEQEGTRVRLSEGRGEENVDPMLANSMLRDALDYRGDPGIAVLLTGDGRGFADGVGFHADLERMHGRGWRIEVLSWQRSCNRRMRDWAVANGRFLALDDAYEHITFLEAAAPGRPIAEPREAVPFDFGDRSG